MVTRQKPDLLDTILRRRRTVKDFLATKEIVTLNDLTRSLKELEKEYIISNEFLKQSEELLVAEESTTTVETNEEKDILPSVLEQSNKKSSKKRSKKELIE